MSVDIIKFVRKIQRLRFRKFFYSGSYQEDVLKMIKIDQDMSE
jgi:hypothetical protein